MNKTNLLENKNKIFQIFRKFGKIFLASFVNIKLLVNFANIFQKNCLKFVFVKHFDRTLPIREGCTMMRRPQTWRFNAEAWSSGLIGTLLKKLKQKVKLP
jgi:hypothetical protein